MDKAFYDRIHKLRLHALAETILVLCVGSFTIFAIATWKYSRLFSFLFMAFAAISGVLLSFLSKKKQAIGLCELPIQSNSLQDVVDSLLAKELFDGTYCSFLTQSNVSIRVLLQYASPYDAEKIKKDRHKANSRINKLYHISEKRPFEEVGHSMRLNMLVCKKADDAISKLLLQNVGMLLSRAEIILNMAVILDEHVVLFPECVLGADFSEIHRYCAAVKAVETCLGSL